MVGSMSAQGVYILVICGYMVLIEGGGGSGSGSGGGSEHVCVPRCSTVIWSCDVEFCSDAIFSTTTCSHDVS